MGPVAIIGCMEYRGYRSAKALSLIINLAALPFYGRWDYCRSEYLAHREADYGFSAG